MGRIPEDTIHAIRDRVDIVDLVGRHVALKKAGRSYKGLCPFHREKTPSFIVNPDRGTYHCFGCGEGGTAFDFLIRHENLTFPEAVRSLAAELGIEVPEEGGEGRGVVEQVLRANEVAQAYFRRCLAAPEGEAARAYLAQRGLSAAEVERHGIGFAPERWDGLVGALAKERVAAEVGERAGLLRARESGRGHYDLLRGRVTFPIRDARGRIVAFGGRALAKEQEPKYLNTPETPVFRKRDALYGLPQALEGMRARERAVVVEGYFDRIALARAGVEEAVATCGTALTEEHAKSLRRRTRNLVLLFDGDEAGQRAMGRALEVLLPEGLRVRAALLPGGADPDDYLKSHGAEALAKLVEAAPPALSLVIRRAAAAGCRTPWERADAVAVVAPLLALLPDPVERGEFARELALAVGAETRDVEASLRRQRRGEEAETAVAGRTLSDDERHYESALWLLFHFRPVLGEIDEAQLFAEAPGDEWRELAECVLRATAAGARLETLLAEAPTGTRRRLTALASELRSDLDHEGLAPQVYADVLARLERRRLDREARALTARLAAGEADLVAKQRQLEARRRAPQRSRSRSQPE
jgi:DNA primase